MQASRRRTPNTKCVTPARWGNRGAAHGADSNTEFFTDAPGRPGALGKQPEEHSMSITFDADSVSVESVGRNSQVRVTVDAQPRDIAAELDIDDRLHDLEPHEIVNHIGADKLLDTMDEAEISGWLSSSNVDPTEFLSAIGEEEVLRWLNNE